MKAIDAPTADAVTFDNWAEQVESSGGVPVRHFRVGVERDASGTIRKAIFAFEPSEAEREAIARGAPILMETIVPDGETPGYLPLSWLTVGAVEHEPNPGNEGDDGSLPSNVILFGRAA
jgi:hypothetical protein